MINARSAALLAEMNELKSSIRAHPRDPSSSHRTDLALDVSHQLTRDSGQPVTVAAALASDPGFAKVMPAIEASNRCGK